MYEELKALDTIRLNFSPAGLHVMNLTLAFIMFGVALDLKPDNFKRIVSNPKSTIIGFLSQFIILPALTFVLVWTLKSYITPSIALGMILVAACPGGNISNFISSLSKANIALSVSLTAIATLAAIVLTPANFAFWGKMYAASSPLVRPIEIDPLQMFQTVFILLGIPLISGIWFSWKFPETTKKIIRPIKSISIIIFVGFVIAALATNFSYFLQHIKFILFIVLIHNALAISTGYFAGLSFRLSSPDRRSVAIETGIQNSGLALVLIFNPKIFPEHLHVGGMAFIAAWWGIWHILSGLFIAYFWSNYKIIVNKYFKK